MFSNNSAAKTVFNLFKIYEYLIVDCERLRYFLINGFMSVVFNLKKWFFACSFLDSYRLFYGRDGLLIRFYKSLSLSLSACLCIRIDRYMQLYMHINKLLLRIACMCMTCTSSRLFINKNESIFVFVKLKSTVKKIRNTNCISWLITKYYLINFVWIIANLVR